MVIIYELFYDNSSYALQNAVFAKKLRLCYDYLKLKFEHLGF